MKGNVRVIICIIIFITILSSCFGYGEKDPKITVSSRAQFHTRRCSGDAYENTKKHIFKLLCLEKSKESCPFRIIVECHIRPKPKQITVHIQLRSEDSKSKSGCHGNCLETYMESTFKASMDRLNSFRIKYAKADLKLGNKLLKDIKVEESCDLEFYLNANRVCIPCENGYFSPDGKTCKPKFSDQKNDPRKSRKKIPPNDENIAKSEKGKEKNEPKSTEKKEDIKKKKKSDTHKDFESASKSVTIVGFVVPAVLVVIVLIVCSGCVFFGSKSKRKSSNDPSATEPLLPSHQGDQTFDDTFFDDSFQSTMMGQGSAMNHTYANVGQGYQGGYYDNNGEENIYEEIY